MVTISSWLMYLLLIVQRGISGMQNGYGYSHKNTGLFVSTVAGVFCTIFMILLAFSEYEGYDVVVIGAGVCSLISVVGLLGVALSFTGKIKKAIHSYEIMATSGIVISLFMLDYNIIDLFLSVSPGMVLHKGFINVGSNLSFVDRIERTNDPTGKTYHLEWLDINIPRFRYGNVRVYLAALAIITFLLNYFIFNLEFNASDIIGLLK